MLCGAAMFHQPRGQSWKTFYEFPPMPNAPVLRRAPRRMRASRRPTRSTAFFVVESKIDNGSQYDESMFPNATAIRQVALPKRSAASDQYNSSARLRRPQEAKGSDLGSLAALARRRPTAHMSNLPVPSSGRSGRAS